MLVEKTNYNEFDNTIVDALRKVKNKYLHHSYNRRRPNTIQRIESIFSHELYHQLRLIQESKLIHFQPFRIDVDLPKYAYNVIGFPCLKGLENNVFKPDIVIHKNQNNTEYQFLIAEIKMDGVDFPTLLYDLQKLIYYKVSPLNFQNAVFIYSGDKYELEEKLTIGLSSTILNCLIENKICVAVREFNEVKRDKWKLYNFNKP